MLLIISPLAFAEAPQLFQETIDTFDHYLKERRILDKFWLSDEEALLAYEHVRNKRLVESSPLQDELCKKYADGDGAEAPPVEQHKCRGNPGEIEFAIRVSAKDLNSMFTPSTSHFAGCELANTTSSCEALYKDFLSNEYDSSKSAAENLAMLQEKLKKSGNGDNKQLDYFFQRRLSISYLLKDELTGKDKFSAVTSLSKSWNVEQKVQFLQLMGSYLNTDYKYDRAGLGGTGKDEQAVFNCDTIFTNLGNGENGDGGICRDIAYCVGKLAISMGLPAYGVSFATNGGFHATLLTYNPDNPNEIYKLNYGEAVSEKSKEGIEGLSQDHSLPQLGTNYRIYDIANNGRLITTLPTELGLFLDQESGANINDLDPFFNPHYSVTSMKVGKGDCQYNVSAGKLTNGDVVLFLSKSIDINENGKLTVGTSTVVHDSETLSAPVLTQTLYLALSQNFYTPSLQMGDFQLRGTGGVRAVGMIGIAKQKETNLLTDGNVDAHVGMEFEKTEGKDTFRATANSQYSLCIKDMRNNQFSDISNYCLANNGAYFQVEYGKELPGDVRIAFDSALALRSIGNSAGASVSVSTNKSEVYAGVSGGFGKKQTAFMPGGYGQTLFLGLNTNASALPLMRNMDELFFQLRYEKDLDPDNKTPGLSSVGIKIVPPKK
jgi:hypothetical protein